MESLIFIVSLLGLGYIWILVSNRLDEYRTKRLLARLALERKEGFDEFWKFSSQAFSKEVGEFMYSLIREFINELDFHPDFPLRPGDKLLKILGNNEYYSEYIFDITVEEFVESEFEENFFVFPQLVNKTVEELISFTESFILKHPNMAKQN